MLALIHSALHKRQLQLQVGREESALGEGLGQRRGGAMVLGQGLCILGWSQSPGEGLGQPNSGTSILGAEKGSGGRSLSIPG